MHETRLSICANVPLHSEATFSPFLLECISGSRLWSLFLVDEGAAIRVVHRAGLEQQSALHQNFIHDVGFARPICSSPTGGGNARWCSHRAGDQTPQAGQTPDTAGCQRGFLHAGSDSVNLLHEVHAQHGLQRKRWPPGLAPGNTAQCVRPEQPTEPPAPFVQGTLACASFDVRLSFRLACFMRSFSQAGLTSSTQSRELCRVSLTQQLRLPVARSPAGSTQSKSMPRSGWHRWQPVWWIRNIFLPCVEGNLPVQSGGSGSGQ